MVKIAISFLSTMWQMKLAEALIQIDPSLKCIDSSAL